MLKTLTKYPILAIGILMMAIFIMDLNRRGLLKRDNLIPTSCTAVRVKLDRRIPSNWKTQCNKNNLEININYPEDKISKVNSLEKLRPLLYRELANYLSLIAKNSPSDNLERTDIIVVKLKHSKLSINAVTEGKYIVKLLTIKDKKMLAEHLKVTVQVKESTK